ncbi:MAG: hypothetical protein AAB270_06855 [Chloroflexota bacterium]
MSLAGYVIHTPGGDIGSRGTGYTYVLAGNGLFLEASNNLLEARLLLAQERVRGLPLIEPELRLHHGRIPAHLLALAVGVLSAQPDLETYAAIVWSGGEYRLVVPEQDQGEAHVTYQVPPGTVVGLHSHGRMGAFFSTIDDLDDQGFQVSVVLGKLGALVPDAKSRLCIYGHFGGVKLSDVFHGPICVWESPWYD